MAQAYVNMETNTPRREVLTKFLLSGASTITAVCGKILQTLDFDMRINSSYKWFIASV